MHAGLSLAKQPHVWVLGSLMPFPSAEAAELLLKRKMDGFDAAIPYFNGSAYPLHGVYDKKCADDVSSLIRKSEICLSAFMKRLFGLKFPSPSFWSRASIPVL